MLHELAFLDRAPFLDELRATLGDELFVIEATEQELPVDRAVHAYPFNSQVLTLPDGSMVIVAPEDSREDAGRASFPRARSGRQGAGEGGPLPRRAPVDAQRWRPRVSPSSRAARGRGARVASRRTCSSRAELEKDLSSWIAKHYRDRLVAKDLEDPLLARETMTALDALTKLLRIGDVYDFQKR